jgi:hypothetical protein
MSKRSKRRRHPATAGGSEAAETPHAPQTDHPSRGRASRAGQAAGSPWGLGLQLAFLVAVFAVAVLVAELAGAANLGVAFGIGQIGFAIAVVYLLVRR